MAERILIVDDEPDIRDVVSDILEDENYQVEQSANAEQAREVLVNFNPDLILLDIWMPDVDGISLLKEWISQGVDKPIIMISGHGNVETAVEAIRTGAYDFLEKPLSSAKMLLTIERALENNRLLKENRELRDRIEPLSTLVGSSSKMSTLRELVERVAPTDSRVLISGEPGTGKRVVARCIHQSSLRKHEPMVEFNLAAVPETMLSVQLFGSESNDQIQPGRFEQAQGGTLYLDELTDMSLTTQSLLENVLEQKQFMREGGNTFIDIDARIISSTSHDIENEVREHRFREALFYYLNVVPLAVPALRDRNEDIPELVTFYTNWMVENENLRYCRFSIASLNLMRNYAWPGNTRELRNVIQRLLILSGGDEIGLEETQVALGESQPQQHIAVTSDAVKDLELRQAREIFEREYFIHQLNKSNRNIAETARNVGMERTHLYRKLKALGIDPKQLGDE